MKKSLVIFVLVGSLLGGGCSDAAPVLTDTSQVKIPSKESVNVLNAKVDPKVNAAAETNAKVDAEVHTNTIPPAKEVEQYPPQEQKIAIPVPKAQVAPVPVVKPILSPPSLVVPKSVCCKHCSAGKACGDSCISRDKTCHKASGCACDS